jgi:hypothetical protein
MDSLTDMIEDARRLIGEGRNKRAADLLTQAAAECRDPAKAAMIHSLALQGQERAGRFGKGRWSEAIRIATLRMDRISA